MPWAGIEPARLLKAGDFKSPVYTISPPWRGSYVVKGLMNFGNKKVISLGKPFVLTPFSIFMRRHLAIC